VGRGSGPRGARVGPRGVRVGPHGSMLGPRGSMPGRRRTRSGRGGTRHRSRGPLSGRWAAVAKEGANVQCREARGQLEISHAGATGPGAHRSPAARGARREPEEGSQRDRRDPADRERLRVAGERARRDARAPRGQGARTSLRGACRRRTGVPLRHLQGPPRLGAGRDRCRGGRRPPPRRCPACR